jgi:hypothetical protein
MIFQQPDHLEAFAHRLPSLVSHLLSKAGSLSNRTILSAASSTDMNKDPIVVQMVAHSISKTTTS